MDRPSHPEALRYATENPYDVPQLAEVIAKTAHEPLNSIPSHAQRESNDCFAKLPWEIREAIANYLPTRDALTLRGSSRSFLPLLASPTFWASRFQPGADRGFLFEKQNTAEPRDWLSLYRMTTYSQSSPGLKNRRRIWDLIQYILRLLHLRSSDDTEPIAPSDISCDDESKLIEATAKIVQPSAEDGTYPVFHDGCRVFQRQHAFIPHDLVGVSMSFVGLGDHGHLSGLCFKSMSGADTQLGYFSSTSAVLCNVNDLSGFVLAIDPRGIRALQIVDRSGARSQWFGFSKDTPVTERLVAFDITKPVRVSIDVS